MLDLLKWLRQQCEQFVFFPAGVYVERGEHEWPLIAGDEHDLTSKLDAGGHLVSLPKESAALANVIEVALVDFLLERLQALSGASGVRWQERSYPDLEISGAAFGGGFHAVDVKMARLNKTADKPSPLPHLVHWQHLLQKHGTGPAGYGQSLGH